MTFEEKEVLNQLDINEESDGFSHLSLKDQAIKNWNWKN